MSRLRDRFAELFVLGALLSLPGVASPGDKASEWRQFRGPAGAGATSVKGLPVEWSKDKNLLWKVELPGAGNSSPIFVGSHLILTTYTGFNEPSNRGSMENLKLHLVALDPKTGKVAWSKDVAPKLPEQPSIRESHGYATSTPAADDQRIYCFFGKSGVHAFSHKGEPVWQADVGSGLNGWGSAASPVLHKDLVFINASVESESLIALDKTTGKERWRARGIRESWSTPVLVQAPGGKTELAVAMFGSIIGFDPESGEKLWSCKTDIPWYMAPSLIAHDGVVYSLGGRPGYALAVRAGGKGEVTASHRLWQIKKGSNVSSPVLHAGHLFWANDSLGMVYCADAATGKIVYEERIPRPDAFYASALLADGKVYYVTRSGQTFVVPAEPKFEILATNELAMDRRDRSTFNTGLVPHAGRLYLRTDRFLYCLGAN